MSLSVRDFEKSFTADNTITQYAIVKVTTTGVDVATGDTDKMIGVAQNAAAATEQVTVRFAGTAKIISSGSIVAGDRITATTSGKGVTTTTDHKTVVGVALEAGTVSGDYCEVLLTPCALISL
jgi:Uncharacterized conserved protein (DUF2190)